MRYELKDYFAATYYVESDLPLKKVAEKIADIESTGPWLGTGEPTKLYLSCRAEVADVRESAPGKGEFDIFFPTANLNMETAAFPSLWLTMIGGGTHALAAYEKSRLLDFQLPDAVLDKMPGPGFGPEGIRKLLGAEENELLIGTIVKPTAGLTAAEVADICHHAALGGVRFIKDDEKMMNTPYCPLDERVRLVVDGLKRAEDETGQRVLYTPHITCQPEYLLKNAEIALENGAKGLMVNFFAAGFNSLQTLRTQIDPNVPIYAHCGGKEALGRAPGQGVDPVAIVRFVRLLGGDIFRQSTIGGYLVGASPEEGRALFDVMSEPLGHIKPMIPAISGGLNPRTLIPNLEIFGTNALMLAGTGITLHPMGIRAGTAAMYQAADAFRKGVSLEEYALEHEELAFMLQ
jgi:ribulose 1,5-bisphosphate carboxylase large subunit-like protein